MKTDILSILSGWLLIVLMPIIHIWALYYFWMEYRFPVNRATCTCECWDSIFKGPYESGIASYKNFYFNATKESLKIWILIVSGTILCYESVKHIIQLYTKHRIRITMMLLFTSSLFPHYYSWWTFINYLNDEFYFQWSHQMFFTITEIISTIFVLQMMDSRKEASQIKLLLIMGIAIMHLIASGIDQLVVNVLFMEGYPHQVVRDFGFLFPDMLHTVAPLLELIDLRSWSTSPKEYWYKDKCLFLQVSITALLIYIGCNIVLQL